MLSLRICSGPKDDGHLLTPFPGLGQVGQNDDAQGEEDQPGRDSGQDLGERAALRHQQHLGGLRC